jgi:hypothetical protein
MYLVQVSLLLIGQQGLVDFFRYWPVLPIGWRIEQIIRQRLRKTTSTAPTTLTAIQAASQSTIEYNRIDLFPSTTVNNDDLITTYNTVPAFFRQFRLKKKSKHLG